MAWHRCVSRTRHTPRDDWEACRAEDETVTRERAHIRADQGIFGAAQNSSANRQHGPSLLLSGRHWQMTC
eukprot:scaffold334_cov241-Pinguiococcus_pyrenoidosus.AAC.55